MITLYDIPILICYSAACETFRVRRGRINKNIRHLICTTEKIYNILKYENNRKGSIKSHV